MTSSQKVYAWDDLDVFVRKAAGVVSMRYRRYGVTYEDITNEIYVWLYTNKRKVQKWLRNSPQQTTRVYRSFLDVATGYAEPIKAAWVGYEVEDTQWYSPHTVEALLPLALDADFHPEKVNERTEDGSRSGKAVHEGGDLLAMVMDVRRALNGTGLTLYFLENESTDEQWYGRLGQLVDFLGGQRPQVGRRKPLSNAQAQALTRNQEVA